MSILETSQILFNLIISLAVIVVTVLASFIAYEVIKFIGAMKKLLADINRESSELYEKIDKFLTGIFTLSFVSNISKFFKKKKEGHTCRLG